CFGSFLLSHTTGGRCPLRTKRSNSSLSHSTSSTIASCRNKAFVPRTLDAERRLMKLSQRSRKGLSSHGQDSARFFDPSRLSTGDFNRVDQGRRGCRLRGSLH